MSKALTFQLFGKINESKSISKGDIGVIGPNLQGEIKIRVENPGLVLKRVEEGDDYVFSVGEKSCSIPKKYVGLSTQPGYDVITFDTNMNWFKQGENKDVFDDVIDEYVSLQFSKMGKSFNPMEEDANMILDILGIDSDIKSCNQSSPLSLEAEISNGMEMEMVK